jgi:hypothetical protein
MKKLILVILSLSTIANAKLVEFSGESEACDTFYMCRRLNECHFPKESDAESLAEQQAFYNGCDARPVSYYLYSYIQRETNVNQICYLTKATAKFECPEKDAK